MLALRRKAAIVILFIIVGTILTAKVKSIFKFLRHLEFYQSFK